MRRHTFKVVKDWERDGGKSAMVRECICSECGCRRQTWKFDYIKTGQKNFYLFLSPKSKTKKFTTEHIGCTKSIEEEVAQEVKIRKPAPAIFPHPDQAELIEPVTLKVLKKNPTLRTGITASQAVLKDSIMIIQLLINKMEENKIEGKELDIAKRFISSVDVEHWKEKFNKSAV